MEENTYSPEENRRAGAFQAALSATLETLPADQQIDFDVVLRDAAKIEAWLKDGDTPVSPTLN